MKGRGTLQSLIITLAALASSLAVFGLFMSGYGLFMRLIGRASVFPVVSPLRLYAEMYRGSFGSWFSWQNTLTRAAPLILTALCTALPARLGLVVIGGEGALVLGGLAAVSVGLLFPEAPALVAHLNMAAAAMLAGGLFIALVGILRERRGVNETIASLLLAYMAIALLNFLVEGPMHDLSPSGLNKPSTETLPDSLSLGNVPGMKVHLGLAFGVIFCVLSYVLFDHSTFGFATRMVGGNIRAAQLSGLPVGKLILVTCLLGGAAAGLAGMVEVTAVHHKANASLVAGYGFTGILVSFIARHHPLAIPPVAVLFGGLGASSGLLQRRLHIPDASVQVLMGIMFVMILLFETFYGRFRIFEGRSHEEEPRSDTPGPTPQTKAQEVLAS